MLFHFLILYIKKTRVAFSLAEILVTLAVVGVIATLTVPSLVNFTNDLEYRSAYKKNFSTLSDISRLVADENGGSMANYFIDPDGVGSLNAVDDLRNKFLKYYNNSPVKTCRRGTGSGVCWHLEDQWYSLNGTSYGFNWDANLYSGSKAVLGDGSFVVFRLLTPACDTFCGDIYIDINGFKGPNRFGKDIQYWYLYNSKIVPPGAPGDGFSGYCSPKTIHQYNGLGCAYPILMGKL